MSTNKTPQKATKKQTATSSFGTGKRESHDASAFYARNLFSQGEERSDVIEFYQRPLYRRVIHGTPEQLPLGLTSASPVEWIDRVFCTSSDTMKEVPDNSVALAFTSPPYNVGKEYDDDMSVQEYLELIRSVGKEVYRTLMPGGRYVINIANLGRKPYVPLHAWFYDIHLDIGFLPMGEIIWQKARRISNSCAWGSWKSAKSPRLRDIHEYLLIFAKDSFSRPDSGISTIERDEFLEATVSIWEVKPESAKRVGHPAPFPLELASRVIQLYSYSGDVILDPFVGSGTTCIAALRLNRHYVGYDVSSDYCRLAEAALAGEQHAEGAATEHKGRASVAGVKTECTELSVALGLLGVQDPTVLETSQLSDMFEGTLSDAKYARFQSEYENPANNELYAQMHSVGRKLRTSYPLFGSMKNLRWTGAQKLANTSSASMDLLAQNTPISVKAGSNVVGNQSPYNIFICMPQGMADAKNADHWYLTVDPQGYQELYTIVRESGLDQLPVEVVEFERQAQRADRDAVETAIQQLAPDRADRFQKTYLRMCHKVATDSAATFNRYMDASLKGHRRVAVLEEVARTLFRMDTVEYILCGVEARLEFAVKVPSLTAWKNDWKITGIEAVPDLRKKQSVVSIVLTYESKVSKAPKTARFHVEIRWSHGKFSQTPEAKLYKDFRWTSIEFLPVLW